MKNKILPILFVNACFVLTSGELFADVIAFDSFAYTAGSDLDGNNGGSGFGNAWSGGGPDVVSPGLEFTDSKGNTLDTSGFSVTGNGSDTKVERDLSSFSDSEV